MSAHDTPARPRRQRTRLFWDKVGVTGLESCWPWLRSKDGHGYGQLTIRGVHRAAHKVAYELTHGPIPAGQCVLHSCDNPACCNPTHLSSGTYKRNTQDMLARGRDGHGEMPGERNPSAKLTEDDVREIRRLRASGLRLREIADRFKITEANVCCIAKRKGWKHVI